MYYSYYLSKNENKGKSMLDPTTLLRTEDYSLRPVKDFKAGDKFFCSTGTLRTIEEVIFSEKEKRVYLETVDGRSLVLRPDHPWLLHNFISTQKDKPVVVCATKDLPMQPPGSNPSVLRAVFLLEEPYTNNNDATLGHPKLRAIVESLGTPHFLDIGGALKDELEAVTEIKRGKTFYWYAFTPDFDYKPFSINPEVFTATKQYREAYLSAVLALCGNYTASRSAYFGHVNEQYISDLKRLFWSVGGIVTEIDESQKKTFPRLMQKSVIFLEGGDKPVLLRLRKKNLQELMPAINKQNKSAILCFSKRVELEPGPMVGLIADEPSHIITEDYLAIYLPKW